MSEAIVERDEVGARKNAVDEEDRTFKPTGGSEDQRLNALAERFGGVLLSEKFATTLAPKMRRTSQRCMARHATPSWCLIYHR